MEVDIVHFMNVNENFGRALKNDDVSCRMEDDTAGVITSFVQIINIRLNSRTSFDYSTTLQTITNYIVIVNILYV